MQEHATESDTQVLTIDRKHYVFLEGHCGLSFSESEAAISHMLCVALIMLAWTRVFGLKGCALWVQHPLVGRRGTSALGLYCEARTDQSLVTVP